MREVADVLTAWTEVELFGLPHTIAVIETVSGIRAEDITAQSAGVLIPDPNWHIRRVWADSTVLDAIAADERFDIIPGTRMAVP